MPMTPEQKDAVEADIVRACDKLDPSAQLTYFNMKCEEHRNDDDPSVFFRYLAQADVAESFASWVD